jgi:hypothetical protein
MYPVETLDHLQKARRIAADGQRDLASQRKLVGRLEKTGFVNFNDLLLEQLENMQGTYVNHLNRLEHKQLKELRFNDAEDV